MAKTTPLATKARTKLDYASCMTTLEGMTIKDERGNGLTVKDLITMTCSANLPDDEKLDMVAKFKIGEIAAVVHKGLDLTSEQISTIKERSAKVLNNPVMVYTFHQILEGHEV